MDDRTLAKRVGAAIRATDDKGLNQFVPKDDDRDGRSSAARLIKSAQQRPTSGIAASFSAAVDNEMLKTDAERREERAHLSHAESAATGGRSAGDVLRKGGTKMTALDAIKGDIATARLRNLLQQAVTVASRRMRKNAADDIVTQGSRRATVTTPRYPPQSRNGQWDDVRAKDGAQSAHDVQEDERQKAGVREKPTSFTGPNAVPHNQSVRDTGLPESQEDGTGNEHEPPDLVAIRRALRPENARPLIPGALGGKEKDPNRFDES